MKRAERPSPEFWVRFEQELRQKQLTALVQKRRWWHDLPVLVSRRIVVPAGAAAIVAFTFISVRMVNPVTVSRVDAPVPSAAVTLQAVELLPATEVPISDPRDEVHDAVVAAAGTNLAHAAVPASGDVTESIELQPLPAADLILDSPSAKSIAANLARLEQSEPELVNAVMGGRLSAPARIQPARASLEEAAAPAPKYRLIARYADHSLTPEPSAPAPVRERIARRLGDDITERISRIGVEGSRVSLKF